MRSDITKAGKERAPHRALLKATGLCDEEIRRPFIGVVNSFNDFIPGHIHLDKLGEAVKAGILSAGGVPFEFQTIGVCDGIAMGHKGMRYSLPSRELIEDSIEIMAEAHQLDGLVMIPSCDKIVPGHIMAAGRLDLPTIVVTGGPMMPGFACDKELDLINVFEGWQAGGPSPTLPFSLSSKETTALRKNFGVNSLYELLSRTFTPSQIDMLKESLSDENYHLLMQNLFGPLEAPQPPRQPGFGPNSLGLRTTIIARWESVRQQLNGGRPSGSGYGYGNGGSMWLADIFRIP